MKNFYLLSALIVLYTWSLCAKAQWTLTRIEDKSTRSALNTGVSPMLPTLWEGRLAFVGKDQRVYVYTNGSLRSTMDLNTSFLDKNNVPKMLLGEFVALSLNKEGVTAFLNWGGDPYMLVAPTGKKQRILSEHEEVRIPSARAFTEKAFYYWNSTEEKQKRIYQWRNGVITPRLELNRNAPDSPYNFFFQDGLAASGDNFAFWSALDNDPQEHGEDGIYASVGGKLICVAGRQTPIPGGKGYFTRFGRGPAISGDNICFLGDGENYQQGVYLWSPTGLVCIADTKTVFPGKNPGRVNFGDTVMLHGRNVVFTIHSTTYAVLDGVLTEVISTDMPPHTWLVPRAFDGRSIAFEPGLDTVRNVMYLATPPSRTEIR